MTQTSPKPTPHSASNSNDQYPNGQSNQPLAANSPSRPIVQDTRSMKSRRQMRGLSLRNKATAVAIALGVLPVFTIGAINYFLSSKDIREDAIANQQETAIALGDEVSRFMFERYGDAQIINNLYGFADPSGRKTMPLEEKEATLNRFLETHKVYDSIIVFDLKGNAIAQSKSAKPFKGNYSDRKYYQEAIRTQKVVINKPSLSKSTGKISVEIAAPIRELGTGNLIGVVRTRMPVEVLDKLARTKDSKLADVGSTQSDNWHLIDPDGKIFAAEEGNQVLGEDVRKAIPVFAQLEAAKKAASAEGFDESDPDKQLVTYAPIEQIEGLPNLNWSVLIHEDTDTVFAAQRRLLLTLLFGTTVTALLVGAIAAYLVDRATRPILNAADALQKMGQGELDTRIAVKGDDEIAVLGSNVNRLGEQIQTLLADQESATRQQLTAQEENVRQQSANAEQQRLGKELLQKRALELLIEVDPVSQGDLTIRANVTEDEIGTVADSYNATIASLRKIVTQVQVAATQMATTTSSSEVSVQELSAEALRQTEEITAALNQLQEMSNSIRDVATSAAQAEVAVQQATQTVEAGDAAMNRTVEGIGAIRDTVAETSIKVKQLGESSQKISKVVKLIGTFAAQTNLLALKASIEAARAGEEGRGFAVLADEVRVLARQSAAATAEIEGLVTGIQNETSEVVAAMEAGTEQVAEGTRLVDETRQSLNQITTVSTKISALVQAIASATVAQSQASESVTYTMTDVAAIANQTSTEANQVSASFKELLAVAQELQASANQFKVN